MSLVEIARFQDVYEADLAAAFLASHGVDVTVTERFQTTLDPLMQRALGIRLLTPASMAESARDLLARAQAGEFATAEGDDLPARTRTTHTAGIGLALLAFATGGFWGNSLPRRFRPVSWTGVLLALVAVFGGIGMLLILGEMLLDPP